MQVKSRIFGDIEIEDDKVIFFESGILGFEDYHQFAIVFDSEKETKNKIMWLQSMEEPELAFPIMDPTNIISDYNPVVEDEWLEPIGKFEQDSDLFLLNILTVPSDITKVTMNLKAPLIINTLTKKGCQLIVNNDEYPIRYNVYEHIQKMKEES